MQSPKPKLIIVSSLAVLALFGGMFLPFASAQAQTTNPRAECEELIQQFNEAKIGNQSAGAELVARIPQYCTQGDVYKKISKFVYYMTGIIGVIFYIYGGYLYMFAGSSQTNVQKGRETILYTTLGIIVVITAAMIVNLAVSFIAPG